MATNILQLPQLEASFSVTTNSDWRDVLQFQWPQGSANAGQPLDITGIAFEAQLRPSATDAEVLLDISTANGLLQVDGSLGQLAFAVPELAPATGPTGCTASLPAGASAVMDIIATADGVILNLGQVAGPFTVAIAGGVTRR